MITIIDANSIPWEILIHGDYEDPEYEYYHQCLTWCHDMSIPYQQLVEVLPHQKCIDDWLKLDRPVDIKMAFDSLSDATMFRLMWGDET